MKKIVLCIIVILFAIFFISTGYRKRTDVVLTDDSINEDNMIGSRYDNPIVPNGFKKIETETASWELDETGNPKGWNKGLVVEDEIGNQFVWVPVKNEDFGNFKKEAEVLMDEESEEEQNQIKRYGGFYIARYEAGVSENMQDALENISEDTNNVEGIPVSKSGIRAWNYISLNKAKKNAIIMYDNEEIKSDLITTRQWLRTVNWIQESGYDFKDMRNLGNFADSFFNFIGLYSEDRGNTYKNGNPMGKVKNFILATGINESAETNNIYDLFGNLMEFTDGYVEDRGYYSVGGYYSETASLKGAYLLGVEPLDKLGFRVVLYFK